MRVMFKYCIMKEYKSGLTIYDKERIPIVEKYKGKWIELNDSHFNDLYFYIDNLSFHHGRFIKERK